MFTITETTSIIHNERELFIHEVLVKDLSVRGRINDREVLGYSFDLDV